MLLWRVGVPSFFLRHSIPLCACTTVFEPLIYWCGSALKLFPALGYCKLCCYEHLWMCVTAQLSVVLEIALGQQNNIVPCLMWKTSKVNKIVQQRCLENWWTKGTWQGATKSFYMVYAHISFDSKAHEQRLSIMFSFVPIKCSKAWQVIAPQLRCIELKTEWIYSFVNRHKASLGRLYDT